MLEDLESFPDPVFQELLRNLTANPCICDGSRAIDLADYIQCLVVGDVPADEMISKLSWWPHSRLLVDWLVDAIRDFGQRKKIRILCIEPEEHRRHCTVRGRCKLCSGTPSSSAHWDDEKSFEEFLAPQRRDRASPCSSDAQDHDVTQDHGADSSADSRSALEDVGMDVEAASDDVETVKVVDGIAIDLKEFEEYAARYRPAAVPVHSVDQPDEQRGRKPSAVSQTPLSLVEPAASRSASDLRRSLELSDYDTMPKRKRAEPIRSFVDSLINFENRKPATLPTRFEYRSIRPQVNDVVCVFYYGEDGNEEYHLARVIRVENKYRYHLAHLNGMKFNDNPVRLCMKDQTDDVNNDERWCFVNRGRG